MALKQPYGSGLAAGRLRESRAVRPGSRTRGGRVDGQAGEVGLGFGSSPGRVFQWAGIRGCTGVCRSDSLEKLMQEECVHFRVGAIWRGKRGPFLSF